MGAGPAGLAHRVLGHEHEAPRRALRHPRRRPRPGLPAPRERARPVRVVHAARPFATYWLHNGLLTKDGKKISKSDPGTIVLMSDLLDDARPRHAPRPAPDQPLPPADRLRPDAGSTRSSAGLQTFYQAFERFEELTGDARSTSSRPRPAAPSFDAGGSAAARGGRRAPPAVPRRDGRRLQHRRRARRAVRGRPRPEPVRRRPDARSDPPRRSAEYRAGMVVLKELTQILGLFRQTRRRSPRPSQDGLTGALLDLLVELRAQAPQGEELRARRRDPQPARRRWAWSSKTGPTAPRGGSNRVGKSLVSGGFD